MNEAKTDLAIYMPFFGNGGIERVILNLVQVFLAKGLKVDLVLNQVGKSNFLNKLPPEVEVFDLKAPGLTLRTSLTMIPKLIDYLKKKQPKTLLSAKHTGPEIAIIAKHLAMVSTRVAVSEQTNLSLDVKINNPLGNQMKSNLIPIAIRFLYPFADGIIAASRGVAQDLATTAKLPLESIEVIYNPVITPQLSQKSQEPVNHPWFAPEQPPVVLGVGRLDRQKDFPTLIKAFAEVRQVQPAKLVILGSGQEEKRLLSLVDELKLKEDVAMLGFVENPYAYMARSAVFVLSSAWEGFGNVVAEALAAGSPVVSTNCPSGPAEILDNGKYGELLPVGDNQAMAKAILRVLSGEIKSVDSHWLEQFQLETVAQKYLDVLQI
ncbi:MAG: glycosyltransferase [Cyanobacteria bacterium P01_H01_bin.35]